MYQPAMRILSTVVYGPEITTFETTQNHLYLSGITVRIVIPRYFGMNQLNNVIGAITVTGPTTFTMVLNSSGFAPAETPPAPYCYGSYPHVVPIGEINSQLNQATHNTLN